MGGSPHIEGYIWKNHLYVGFGHQNGNTDNAYFYRKEDGIIDCGVLDWGSTGYYAFASEIMGGSFGSALAEMLIEYDDRLIGAFVEAYHATGATPIDVDELIM